jgi:hypothetical protein
LPFQAKALSELVLQPGIVEGRIGFTEQVSVPGDPVDGLQPTGIGLRRIAPYGPEGIVLRLGQVLWAKVLVTDRPVRITRNNISDVFMMLIFRLSWTRKVVFSRRRVDLVLLYGEHGCV